MQRDTGEQKTEEERPADFRLITPHHAASSGTEHADQSAPGKGEEFPEHFKDCIKSAKKARKPCSHFAHTEKPVICAFLCILVQLSTSLDPLIPATLSSVTLCFSVF